VKVSELETPALLIDQQKLMRNITYMQEVADSSGVTLRPHIKTHKCPEIAKLQVKAGARGICGQKLGEVEVMAQAGFQDILIPNEIVQPTKIARLIELQEKATIKIAVDSLENAQSIGKVAASRGRTISVYVDVDTGMKRCGIPLGPSVAKFSKKVASIKGLRLEGLTTYEGHLYKIKNAKKRAIAATRIIKQYVEVGNRLRKAGVEIPKICCASTLTATVTARVPGVSELHPGNYVFYDLMQVERGSAVFENCAQSVLTTVISTPTNDRCVVDAGTKAFVNDQCMFPRALHHADLIPYSITEEHLACTTKKTKVRVGDKVQFVPYHACTATNMFDQLYLVNGDEVVENWPISARGKMV
jgi:D-serine deaminase-like pyridoxal phosphate-dependent protein